MLLLRWSYDWLPTGRQVRRGLLAGLVLASLGACETPSRPTPAATSAAQLNDAAERQLLVAPLEALPLARQAEAAAVQRGDKKEQARALKLQGNAYHQLEDYAAALAYQSRALALNEQLGDSKGQGACLINIGNVYKKLKQYPKALELYHRVLLLARQRNDSVGEAHACNNLGNTVYYLDTTQILPSLRYYQRAMALFRTVHNPNLEAMVLNNTGNIYLTHRRYAEARPYFVQSLRLSRQTGNHRQQAICLLNLGHVSRGLRQLPAGLAYYQQSTAVGRVFPDIVRKNLQYMAETQALLGNFAAAYTTYRRFTAIKDSTFNRETTDRISELETRFETAEKEKQLQLQRLTIVRKTQLLYATLAATALLLALAGGLWHQTRQRSRANRALAQANEEIRASVAEKEVLLQEVHHRVKNNLQMVSSLLSWQSRALPDPALVQALADSRARIQSMALVHEHLYQSASLAHLRLDTYLAELLAALHAALGAAHAEPRITLHTELAPLPSEASQAIALGLLLNEVVTNAYKHAFRGRTSGQVRVVLEGRPAAGFCLRMEDDGVGLPAGGAVRPHALGMQLVRLLTKQLKATLTTTPNQPSGTRFSICREG